jgi:hypothetical protein
MCKTYNLNVDLTLQQVIQLQALTGVLDTMPGVFAICNTLMIQERVFSRISAANYCATGRFSYKSFQLECEKLAAINDRTTVTINNKKYYEDELALALANINEVKDT